MNAFSVFTVCNNFGLENEQSMLFSLSEMKFLLQ